MSEDKSLEENFETANARISPGNIGGMGAVSLPNAENGNIGSGDVPNVADIDDDEEEAKKDKTKKKLEMEGFKLFTQFDNFINEAFEDIADLTKALHFEMDPKRAEEMKIELGKRQGEVTKRKQIEGGDYSLRRFRKEIKFGDGTYLGVFLPGSYDAATSTLGDGPHKKAMKRVKWNQKKYDQWLEDVASNDGWKNAFDMAQNAKHEPGLIDWAKKEFRGEDVMQRIQWDIEAFAESVVTEDFPGKGETVKAKDLNHEMLDYFNRMNMSLSINTKSKKNIKGSVGTMFNDLVFNGGDIDKKDIVSVKIIESVVTEANDHFSEFCKLNEAKSVDRDEMMKWIKKSMDFVGTSEDFNGSQGGIHVSGEAHDEYKGAIIYSYYSEDYKNREFGVWNKWEKELNKRGWYSEWYDAGTVCIWPL